MDKNAEIRELVKARLSTFPVDKKICIGSYGEFSRDDLIKHVSKEDDIGKKIIEIELAYIRALKKGIVV
jgi:hypothetical protein